MDSLLVYSNIILRSIGTTDEIDCVQGLCAVRDGDGQPLSLNLVASVLLMLLPKVRSSRQELQQR
jgi:hypothetical protein